MRFWVSKNKSVEIDAGDFDLIAKYSWYIGSNGYAVTRPWIKETKSYRSILMHRYLMNPPDRMIVDHKNRIKTDNRRKNLRVCTHKENIRNSKHRKNNTSGHRGVFLDKRTGHWVAKIMVDYKSKSLGSFDEKESAVKAYRCAAKKYFGRFVNFSTGEK